MKSSVLCTVLVVAITAACAKPPIELAPGARAVALLANPPIDILTAYEGLGTVSCQSGRGSASEGLIDVLIASQQLGGESNRAVMVGTVYRRRR